MERIIDKGIILIGCMAVVLLVPLGVELVLAFLCSLTVSALCETRLPFGLARRLLPFVYLLASLVIPLFALFVPLVAYDCFGERRLPLRLAWAVPLVAAFVRLPLAVSLLLALFSTAACLLAWRTSRTVAASAELRRLHDALREETLRFERENRMLLERQDLEVRLARLGERGRIAREMHDNVGHMLTRSILQVEALQVVHTRDDEVREGLAQLSSSIHQAFETVRESIHNLHDDSFDLHEQLRALAEHFAQAQGDKDAAALDFEAPYSRMTGRPRGPVEIELMDKGGEVSPEIGHCLLAIAREAVANAARHSDARRVQVRLTEHAGFWQLVVHDDGSSNPLDQHGLMPTDTGMGVAAMEQRVRAFDGVFRVSYQGGLRIQAVLPKSQQ
ncbi:MAG: histidine kinase [Coriobacteriales bacterium]|jgi:signal transduction histidine kinase|nr:histidine kinase [Coriobacteriales bacterium]